MTDRIRVSTRGEADIVDLSGEVAALVVVQLSGESPGAERSSRRRS